MKFFLALVVVLLFGCAAPGSSIGRVAFSGTVDPALDRKVSMQVTLPSFYGLDGLDLALNRPEDFGNSDRTVVVEVRDGAFSYEFEPIVYHVTFWILPPLGGFPRHPPAPRYFVTFSDTPGELYVVGMDRKAFRYEVYDKKSRELLQHENASWSLVNGAYLPEMKGGNEIWHLRFQAKPNQPLHRDASGCLTAADVAGERRR